MDHLFMQLGRYGKKGASLEGDAAMMLGRKRAAMIGGGVMGGAMIGTRRSSARHGLAPKGSAPPPGQLPYGY